MGIGFVGVGDSILVQGFLGGLIFANFIINTLYNKVTDNWKICM